MQKVKVSWEINGPVAGYTVSKPQFAWLGRPLKTGEWPQITGWHSCRETFASEMQHYCREKARTAREPHFWSRSRSLDTARLRIAVRFFYRNPCSVQYKTRHTSFVDNYSMHGIHIVNLVEKYLGWPKSKLLECNDNYAYMLRVLSGSAKWLRSSQLLSLYMLLFRLGVVADFGKLENAEQLMKYAVETPRNSSGTQRGTDLRHLNTLGSRLKFILDNVDKLFFFRTQRDAWACSTGIYGITNYVGNYADKKAKAQYKAVMKVAKTGAPV